MLIFMLGTTAELIKLRPVIERCGSHTERIEIWCTAQQYSELTTLPDVASFLNSVSTRWLSHGFRGKSISKSWHVPVWAAAVVFNFTRLVVRRRDRGLNRLLIVHGDTMTTALGALLGRLTNCSVAHIEAGLRSGDWRNPFPEELCRRVVGRVADLHFAPSDRDATNLRGVRGDVVITHGNTAVDNLTGSTVATHFNYGESGVLVLLHRVEFLSDPAVVQQTLRVMIQAAIAESVTIVVDALARQSMSYLPEFHELSLHPNVRITQKLPHAEFVSLIRSARVVITDSGGVQEEAAALGIPCIVHRVVSERSDGLHDGGTAALTGLNPKILTQLLNDPPPHGAPRLSQDSPSDIILHALKNRGWLE